MPKPAVSESPKQMMRFCAESCADGEGLCVVGAGGVGVEGAGAVAGAVSVVVVGLQPVRRRPAAREVRAIKAIVDRLGATRAWFTGLF